jgi:hypothetical protein
MALLGKESGLHTLRAPAHDPAVANGVVYFADGDPFNLENAVSALHLP